MDETRREGLATWLASQGLSGGELIEALPAHQTDPGRSSRWRSAGGLEVWVEDALTHPIGGFDALPAPLDLREDAAALVAGVRRLGSAGLPGLVPWHDVRLDDAEALVAFVREPVAPVPPSGSAPAELARRLAPLTEAIDRAGAHLPHGLCVTPASLAWTPEGALASRDWGLESFRRLGASEDPETKLGGGGEMAALLAGLRAGKRPLPTGGPVAEAAPRVAFVRLWFALRTGASPLFHEDLARLPAPEAQALEDTLTAPESLRGLLARLGRAPR
ncbi:MAG: hypothetical protein AAGH15_01430 [Myxococcota bacterium]